MTQDECAPPDIVVDTIDKARLVRFIFLRGSCLREAGAISENARKEITLSIGDSSVIS
jgi:hypothetical protein